MTSDETVNLHMAATGLHYGQEAFEGLKAFRGVDGQVRIFRADETQTPCVFGRIPAHGGAPARTVHRYGQAGGEGQRALYPALRHGRIAVHPSGAFRQRAAGGCEAGGRVPVDYFRYAGGALTTKRASTRSG